MGSGGMINVREKIHVRLLINMSNSNKIILDL